MSLKRHSHEEVIGKSLIELARLIMLDEREAINFNDLFERVSELKGLTDAQKQAKIGQFYTDLNVDGNFTTNGSNIWGLKSWYRVEREVEEPVILRKTRIKRKRKDAAIDSGIELEEFKMIDESIDVADDEYDEYEELDEFEDEEEDVFEDED